MFLTRHHKCVLILALVIFIPKSKGEENSHVSDTCKNKGGSASSGTGKEHDAKLDENDQQPSSKLKNENPVLESGEQDNDSNSGKDKFVKVEDVKVVDDNKPNQKEESKQKGEQRDQNNQPIGSCEGKSDDTNIGESNQAPLASDSKKPTSKDEDNNRKISLSDVNAYTADDEHIKDTKRETSYSDFLGMPRDASYFFDDHEPFINMNNTENRVGRAAPSRESKNQKLRLSVKGKDSIQDDVDDDDEENEIEEEEKQEDDYDDDEEGDSDCQPTTSECPPTTTACDTPTTCKCTTESKCTTEAKCTTTPPCKTTQEKCTTKCPKICAKANRKVIGYRTTESPMAWDMDKRKITKNRRKTHNKLNGGH